MSPGPVTSAVRGGYSFSRSSALAPRTSVPSRHAYERTSTPFARNRDFGQRNRFAVSANPDTGGHSIALDDHEAATVTLQPDGSCVIEIANKPEDAAGGNGGNAGTNGNGAIQSAPLVENAHRAFAGQRARMSWERDPRDGSVTFTPGADEVLDVDGDAIQAVVSAHPSPAMPKG